jgi:hypothetical protein
VAAVVVVLVVAAAVVVVVVAAATINLNRFKSLDVCISFIVAVVVVPYLVFECNKVDFHLE